MTGDMLQTHTRKQLAAMARRRHISGWHDMRKADLIEALVADGRREEELTRTLGSFSVDDNCGWFGRDPQAGRVPDRRAADVRVSARHLLRAVDRERDHFVAHALNPYWIRAEWMVSRESVRRIETALGAARHTAKPVLRLYDVSADERLTHALTFVSDATVPDDAHEWFLEVDQPGGVYQVQLGVRAEDGEFYRIASSKRIHTGEPSGCPVSPVVRQPADGSPTRRRRRKRVGASVPLSLDVELVVHGVTHPQAGVAVSSDVACVEPDGSFEHCLPLTDGRHVIPVTASSADRRWQQTIVVAIERNTKCLDPKGPDDV